MLFDEIEELVDIIIRNDLPSPEKALFNEWYLDVAVDKAVDERLSPFLSQIWMWG